jgi:hypothetical protein
MDEDRPEQTGPSLMPAEDHNSSAQPPDDSPPRHTETSNPATASGDMAIPSGETNKDNGSKQNDVKKKVGSSLATILLEISYF